MRDRVKSVLDSGTYLMGKVVGPKWFCGRHVEQDHRRVRVVAHLRFTFKYALCIPRIPTMPASHYPQWQHSLAHEAPRHALFRPRPAPGSWRLMDFKAINNARRSDSRWPGRSTGERKRQRATRSRGSQSISPPPPPRRLDIELKLIRRISRELSFSSPLPPSIHRPTIVHLLSFIINIVNWKVRRLAWLITIRQLRARARAREGERGRGGEGRGKLDVNWSDIDRRTEPRILLLRVDRFFIIDPHRLRAAMSRTRIFIRFGWLRTNKWRIMLIGNNRRTKRAEEKFNVWTSRPGSSKSSIDFWTMQDSLQRDTSLTTISRSIHRRAASQTRPRETNSIVTFSKLSIVCLPPR
jgi:hypothetical protein